MKRLPSWLVRSTLGLRAPDRPELLQARLNSMQRSRSRRLSDRVEATYEEACLSGDLETAELLLAAVERLHREFAGDRRLSDAPVARLREEFARHKAAATRAAVACAPYPHRFPTAPKP